MNTYTDTLLNEYIEEEFDEEDFYEYSEPFGTTWL